jgi:catechol 2,3-dioxygenase-like lactoylglutathione lyase family enzyme
LTVTDLEASRRFYRDVVGLAEVPRPDLGVPGLWFGLDGDLQLHILVNEELRKPEAERRSWTVCYPHFALWTADVRAKARALRDAGHEVLENAPPGAGFAQVFVKDQDGNMVEFIGPGGSS